VVKRLVSYAEKQQLEKERIQTERLKDEQKQAKMLANLNRDKVLKQRRPRSTNEFLND